MARATISSSVLSLVVVVVVSVLYMSGRPAESAAAVASNFIKTSCSSTTYPAKCVQSLAAYSSTIQRSPRQLVQTALSVSIDRSQSAKSFMTKLTRFKGLKPREYAAIKDCLEEVNDSIDRLSKSLKELKSMKSTRGKDFIWHMSNVQTWVSAALTDENTCMDGFAGRTVNGRIKNSVRAQVTNVAQVTSNALSLVNQFAARKY